MDEMLREYLHEELDQILAEREALEHDFTMNASLMGDGEEANPALESRTHWAAASLLERGSKLAANALGERLQRFALAAKYEDDAEQRPMLRRWLMMLNPLLAVRPSIAAILGNRKELSVFEVIDALSALEAGETRTIFAAKTGRNRRKNHWSLARAKLQALMWKKRLKALGRAEKDANFHITVAFAEQWDTVRRWQGQCERILGSPYVSAHLGLAGTAGDPYMSAPSGALASFSSVDPMKALSSAGDAYQAEKRRAAALSPSKGRTRTDK